MRSRKFPREKSNEITDQRDLFYYKTLHRVHPKYSGDPLYYDLL